MTTVHTGEFWSGSLAVLLLSVMGIGGLALVSRRRLFSAAQAIARRGSKFRP